MAIHDNKQQKPLTMALKFILKNNLATRTQLCSKHILDPKTLRKIEANKTLRHDASSRYLEVFLDIIDNFRCSYEDDDEKHLAAKAILFDMFLLSIGKPTEAERHKNKLLEYFRRDNKGG